MAGCPFTSRLPTMFKNNYTSSLLRVYSKWCPVASRMMITTAGSQAASTMSKPVQRLQEMIEFEETDVLKQFKGSDKLF